MLLLALSLAIASDWTLYDETDNLTGKRSISAIVLPEQYQTSNAPTLFMHCHKGSGPRFDLFASEDEARSKFLPEREIFGEGAKPVYISFVRTAGKKPAEPMFWRANGNSLLYDGGAMAKLIEDAAVSEFVEISVLTDTGKLSGSYSTAGLKKAYDYMASHCTLVSEPYD